MSESGVPRWSVPVLAVAPALVVAAVVVLHVSHTVPFDSDEANHANLGLRQFQDLADGRLLDFLRHSYRTGQFPFLHGWMLLPGYALFGATLFAARITQVALFVIGAGATGHAAYRATGDDPRAGIAASWLFALSPALAAYSGLCMLETPGAALTAITLAVFAEACRAQGRRATLLHGLTALAALATYFTKLNYGLWIAPAVLAGHALRLLPRENRRAALRHALVYLGTLLVIALAWYSRADARAAFLGFLHNPAERVAIERDDPSFHLPGVSPSNFLAYFPLVATSFHLHWIVGAAVMLVAAWGALSNRHNAVLTAAAACVVWTWVVLAMGFREYALDRFIATAMPPLWVLAGAGASSLARRLYPQRFVRARVTLAIVVTLVAQCVALPRRLTEEYEVDARCAPVFTFLADTISGPADVLAVGYTDHTSARMLVFALATARPASRFRDFDVKGFNAERVYESAARFDTWMDAPRTWGDASWKSHVVEFVPGPRYLDAEIVLPATVALWHDAVARRAGRLERTAERRFEDLDLTVIVWTDTTPPR